MPRYPNLLSMRFPDGYCIHNLFSQCEFVLSKPNTIMSWLLRFQVLLHNPTDFPTVVNQYFRVPLDRDVVVGIKPNVMNTSTELRSYLPERRQCFFTTERHLLHFSIYTQANCDTECYTNYTLKKCGCVAYYMPRELKFLGTTFCIQGPKTTKHTWYRIFPKPIWLSLLLYLLRRMIYFFYIYFDTIAHISTKFGTVVQDLPE
jgi:hypothetical protein